MKRFILLSLIVCLGLATYAQSPLKTVSFHKNPDEIVDFRELKEKAGRDSDLDGNKAARIRVKAQGFDEKKMLDFTVFPRPGMEVIYKEFQQGEMWVYVSSKVQGTLVIKYMGEFEFKLPSKLEPKCGYDLVLGMETATLVISTIPSDAEIFVDGRKVGTGYGSAAISVGSEHRYKVSRDYYIPEEDVVKSDEAVKITKQIELRPNFSYITIKTEPSGAEIYIDGKKVGTTPYLSEMIEFGRRRVELKKSGYEPYVKVVTIKPEEEENTLLSNVKLEAVRVPMGSLDLSSNPTGAVITINGRQYGQTPKTLTDLEVGTYTVYFSKEGYQNLSQTVEIKDGKMETLAVTMTKTVTVEEGKMLAVDEKLSRAEVVKKEAAPSATSVKGTGLHIVKGSFKEIPGFFNINPDPDYQYDDNNLPFAVVKVRTENITDKQRRELKFEGNAATFIMLEDKTGEVWVYLTARYADYLKISHPDLSSTEFTLPYDLKPKCGYEMTLVNNAPNNGTSAKVIGVFSVSANKKVHFSQGNLQYQASTKTWRFAEHQWDVIGEANKNISSSYSGWIDLFGWGTSGYNGKNPWMISTTSTDYGNGERDIAGTNYDWGVNNTISNGEGKSWRTLTGDEWVYVFDERSTSSGIRYAKATVNGVNGVILLPDNWSSSSYSLSNTNKRYASFNSNRISQTDWTNKFEANGAVFLPAAGHRYVTDVKDFGSYGHYWSAAYDEFNGARSVWFHDGNLIPVIGGTRYGGFSVRLVCSAQ